MSSPLRVPRLDVDPNTTPVVVALPVRPRYKLGRIGETAALAVLFGFTLEAACRIEDWVQYRTPIFALERSQMDLLIRDAEGMHGRPGGRFQKWSLNAFGMRGPEASVKKPANVVRIVSAGASETFGLYESPGNEYPRQLEDSLNAGMASLRAACGQWRAQVLNAAMPGMSLPTIEQDLRLRVQPLNPDFVIVYATPPTYLYDAAPVAARPDSSSKVAPRLPAYYALFPRVAQRLRTQLKSLLPDVIQDRVRRHEIDAMLDRHPPDWRFNSVPAERLKAFEADLRQTVGTIRSIGAIPVLMTHANRFVGSADYDESSLRMWEKFYPRASGETIVAFDSAARVATMIVARDSQAVLVDLADTLARTGDAAFADYSHFTDRGAALAAGAVSGSILSAPAETLTPVCKSGER